jgi:hypothetical protein
MNIIPIALPGRFFSTLPVPIKGFEDGDLTCDYYDPVFSNMQYFWILWALGFLLFLNYKVSRVRKAFNEYSENKYALLLLCLLLIVMFALGMGSQNFRAGQIAIVMVQLVTSNALFWFTMYKPIVGFLFRREAYLFEWRRGLRDENLPSALLYGVPQSSTAAYLSSALSQNSLIKA